MHPRPVAFLALIALTAAPLAAQRADTAAYSPTECPPCTAWNAPQRPFRVHGTTWYVGTRGLSALLITSPQGHVLLDAGLPESAPRIIANIRAAGFRPEDIELIVNSHAHYDHAGGIAALQRVSGARAAASPRAVDVLRTGKAGPDDPQAAVALPFPPVAHVERFAYGDSLRVGPIVIASHHTAGHAPGGTSWSWRSCEGSDCVDIVYADSQTPVSADDFAFTRSTAYPEVIKDFERGFSILESLKCDILITPHPGASMLFERIAGRKDGPRLIDPDACKRYAAAARQQLQRRIEAERKGR